MNREDRLPGLLLAGLLVLTITRLVIGCSNELSEDEAYYFMWSQRLDWSYYSKGPGIATALKISTSIFGDGTLGIRILSPLLALGSSLLVWRLARSMFDARVAAWTVLLLNLTPLFNAGALVMTIDPLSIFFWLAAMLALWRALHRNAKVGIYWPLAGLLMGLGFLAKYTNALQLLSLFVLLVCSRRWRPLLLKPGLYVMLAVFALCTLPVFIWNSQNDWITFTHLAEHTENKESGGAWFNPLEFIEYFLGHLGVYSPLLFLGLVWAVARGARQLGNGDGEAFLAAFAVPIVGMYFLLSFKQSGELNWTAPGFISAAALLPLYWRRSGIGSSAKGKLQAAALVLAGGLSLILMNTDVLRAAGLNWSYGVDKGVTQEKSIFELLKKPHQILENTADLSYRLRGLEATAVRAAETIRAQAEQAGEPVFAIANRYQTAAALNYYLDADLPLIRPTQRHPRVHTMESQAPQHQFSFWPSYAEVTERDQMATADGDTWLVERSDFLGKNAVYVTDDTFRLSPPDVLKNAFARWELVDVVRVMRRGEFVRGLKVFACYEYGGSDL